MVINVDVTVTVKMMRGIEVVEREMVVAMIVREVLALVAVGTIHLAFIARRNQVLESIHTSTSSLGLALVLPSAIAQQPHTSD